jgi:ELWxxDGT repeat protein
MSSRVPFTLALLGLLAGLPALQAQPAFLVRDINADHPAFRLWEQRDEMEASGGQVFFAADDGVHGKELWVNDGSPSGDQFLGDLCPGACSSNPTSLVHFGGLLYFVADDGVHGREIWRTDGTAAGTTLAVDVNPGVGDGVDSLADAGGQYLFGVLAATGTAGKEPFRTDGTPAGTQGMGDLNPGPAGSNPRFLALSGSRTLFTADDGAHGTEIWCTAPRSGAGTRARFRPRW